MQDQDVLTGLTAQRKRPRIRQSTEVLQTINGFELTLGDLGKCLGAPDGDPLCTPVRSLRTRIGLTQLAACDTDESFVATYAESVVLQLALKPENWAQLKDGTKGAVLLDLTPKKAGVLFQAQLMTSDQCQMLNEERVRIGELNTQGKPNAHTAKMKIMYSSYPG